MTTALPFSPDDVRRLLADRDWRLLDKATPSEWEAFLADVAAFAAGPNPKHAALSRAVAMAYGRVLHTACMADGTRRQQRAFTELGVWVYRRLRGQVPDENDARDLMQEVLLTVFQERDKVDRPLGFLAWVARIVHNRLQRYYKKRSKRPPDVNHDEQPDESVVEIPPSAAEIEAAEAELLALLERCLGRQAHTQRLIFIMLFLRGRSLVEVATLFKMRVRSLQRALNRLLERLRECRPLIAHLLAHLPPSRRAAYEGR
ncbi:MAG: sigma-70 family RNA polymerase sigma factor [Caldilineales bacterium]|nr:sigma-70 family RNA polymerase sigma factor [Caldilineales bacterium]